MGLFSETNTLEDKDSMNKTLYCCANSPILRSWPTYFPFIYKKNARILSENKYQIESIF